jgi:hypothetical protein
MSSALFGLHEFGRLSIPCDAATRQVRLKAARSRGRRRESVSSAGTSCPMARICEQRRYLLSDGFELPGAYPRWRDTTRKTRNGGGRR